MSGSKLSGFLAMLCCAVFAVLLCGEPAGAVTGDIMTVAGGHIGDGNPATDARVNRPRRVALDGSGNLYIAEQWGRRVRKVDAQTGIITTVAGSGMSGFEGDGGPATEADIWNTSDAGVDASGNIYFTDSHRVRKVDAQTGIVTTVVGTEWGFSGDGGPATEAAVAGLNGLFVDGSGNIYTASDANHRIRKVDAATGIITTVAGNGERGYSGDGGPATEASLNGPVEVHVDGAGNLYISDKRNQRIRKVDAATGLITTVAGNGNRSFSGDGEPATDASIRDPDGIFLDSSGNLYIADRLNRRIRKVDAATGLISTVAGGGSNWGDGGPATEARMSYCTGVALDAAGNIHIAEEAGYRIRKVDAAGIITTVAGTGGWGYDGDGRPATQAMIQNPWSVFVDGKGDLYIGDYGNGRVRKVEGVAAPTTLSVGVFSGPTMPALSATSGGSGVAVELVDAKTGEKPVTLSFSSVTGAGVSTLTVQGESKIPPPSDVQWCEPKTRYRVTTTAAFSGSVEVGIRYGGATVIDEAGLKLFWLDTEQGMWVDVTTSLNTSDDIIFGQATAFPATFAFFEPRPEPVAATEMHRVVVVATVTRDGAPAAGLEVSFSRSISGRALDFRWKGTTGSDGKVEIEIVAEDPMFWRTGASGYYLARAVDPTTGNEIGRWGSIPINGGMKVAISLPIGGAARVESESPLTKPVSFGLEANSPNPFNPSTQIAYRLSEAGEASLVIYSTLGQEVRRLVRGYRAAGAYRVTWDGTDALGRPVSSGLYLYRLMCNGMAETRRMLLLK